MPILVKINQVMQKVRGVEKTKTNTHGKFMYAGHEDVNEALRGHFADLGIVRCARMLSLQAHEGTIICECTVTYTDVEDGSSIEVPMWAVQPSQTSKGSLTAQQVGQALSYATKNVEFKLFALTGDNEPDADSSDAYNPNAKDKEPEDDGASVRVKELFRMFEKATTKAEVEEVNAMFKAEWKTLSHVPHVNEGLVASRTSALKRIAGAQ